MKSSELFDFVEKNKNTTLSSAYKRIMNICNRYDHIFVSVSGGKDSVMCFCLFAEEILRRKMEGDEKKIPTLYLVFQDTEIIYKDTYETVQKLCREYGWGLYKNNKNGTFHSGFEPYRNLTSYIEAFKNNDPNIEQIYPGLCVCYPIYKCLPISIQANTSSNKRLICWEGTTSRKIPGILDISAWPITLEETIFSSDYGTGKNCILRDGKIILNFGLGSSELEQDTKDTIMLRKRIKENKGKMWFYKGMEDEGKLSESYSFSVWAEESLQSEKCVSIVSIRKSESLDRRKILKSADRETGVYGYIRRRS